MSQDLAEHLRYFQEIGVMGISRDPAWRARAVPSPAAARQAAQPEHEGGGPVSAPGEPAAAPADGGSSVRLLAVLKEEIGPACTRCKLHTLGRKQVVFGVGNPDADLMFVGEAPGADEDQQGEPFVGRAGQLLTKIIEAIGMRRDEVYIANVIKCRPAGQPQSRSRDEVEQCEPFLFRQIDAIKPKVIVALGKFAAQSLLKTHGTDHAAARPAASTYRGATLIPTFHPAYLLRNPVVQARGVGGHEEGARHPARRRVSHALVSVAVPVPALDLLTYRVPETEPMPSAGARVIVPLGRRPLTGVVIGEAAAPDGDVELRDILKVLDREPSSCRRRRADDWVADYYMAGPGAALVGGHAAARARPAEPTRFARRGACSSPPKATIWPRRRRSALRADEAASRSGTRQREAIAAVERRARRGCRASTGEPRRVSAVGRTRLKAMGLVTVTPANASNAIRSRSGHAALPDASVPDWSARVLTEEQQAAVESLLELSRQARFQVALLHGVTGSGKTEVYLRLADEVRRAGRGVLMLVPEIALTPAVAAVFRAAVRRAVAIQHSGLSDGERHDQWHRIRRGDVDARRRHALGGVRAAGDARPDHRGRGARHLLQAGGDAALSRPRRRDHARQVRRARWSSSDRRRRRSSRATTREQGRYARVTLTRRVLDRPLAAVRVVNMREEFADGGTGRHPVARAAGRRCADALERREQVLVLLNRRGYAAAVFCRQCGSTLECPNCSVSLTVHTGRRATGARAATTATSRAIVPKQCANCAAPYLEHVGFGTERVEAEIAALVSRCARRTRSIATPSGGGAAWPTLLDALRARRARRPGRHADDRQGPRLSSTSRWSA